MSSLLVSLARIYIGCQLVEWGLYKNTTRNCSVFHGVRIKSSAPSVKSKPPPTLLLSSLYIYILYNFRLSLCVYPNLQPLLQGSWRSHKKAQSFLPSDLFSDPFIAFQCLSNTLNFIMFWFRWFFLHSTEIAIDFLHFSFTW